MKIGTLPGTYLYPTTNIRDKLIHKSTLQRNICKSCSHQKMCKVCNGKHPTTLYGYIRKKAKPEEQKTGSSDNIKRNYQGVKYASINFGTGIISMCGVLVKLQHNISGNIIKTYTLPESCSQGTFMFEKLLNKLEVKGCKTSITI